MTRYIGLDVHKRFIEVCILDAAGKIVYRGQVVCEKDQLEDFCRKRFKKSDHVVLEATGNTWSVVAIVQPFVERIVVSNPLRTKAIAEAKIKTDKVDALVLAQLLRCDFLPLVWQPDEKTQRFRGLMTHRTGLMTHRSRIKNRIQSLLARWLLKPPCSLSRLPARDTLVSGGTQFRKQRQLPRSEGSPRERTTAQATIKPAAVAGELEYGLGQNPSINKRPSLPLELG